MAATSSLLPKLHCPKSRSSFIPRIVNHLLRQQTSARLIVTTTRRPSAAALTSPSPGASANRPFMSSTPPARLAAGQGQEPSSESISGEDWEKLSPEAKIRWMGDDRWGWVVYRCSCAKEFDDAWSDLNRRITQGARERIARSDAPSVAETMDFVFVEDPALEGASVQELRRRFQDWARRDISESNNASGVDIDGGTQGSRGPRYELFLKVDAEALWNGYVGLVQAWPSSPGSEDWMKVRTSAVTPALYVAMLDEPEVWYAYYTPPETGVCNAF